MSSDEVPSILELKKAALDWVVKFCDDPLRGQLLDAICSDKLHVAKSSRSLRKDPTTDLGGGADEKRRFREATEIIEVTTRLTPGHPVLHVFVALAVARAIARKLNGVILYDARLEFVPLVSHEEPLPADGRIVITKHIRCMSSIQSDGLGWMTTVGMPPLGMPNLEMRHIPPNLSAALLPIFLAVAQRLIDAVVAHGGVLSDEDTDVLGFSGEILVSYQDALAAYGGGSATKGQTTVGLRYDGRGRVGLEPFMELGRPSSHEDEASEWYFTAVNEFLGERQDAGVHIHSAEDPVIAVSHRRALSEWQSARSRFVGTNSPSQLLYVKRRFDPSGKAPEYMWVVVTALESDAIVGTLVNNAVRNKGLRAGLRVRFPETEVFDWLLLDGDQHEGGYTQAPPN